MPETIAAKPAAEMPEYRIPRLELEVRIDGVLDEPAWQQALVFELLWETDPGENVEPTVRTECRMFYDRRNLYYGCHAFDPEPEKIRARYRDRDAAAFSDDLLGLSIDPFDSQNRSFVLDVNPLPDFKLVKSSQHDSNQDHPQPTNLDR